MGTRALEIDGIFASELRDQQGELLSLEGADISDLQAGLGTFNDNHSPGLYNVLGKITFAKKIFSKADCSNAREEYFWDKVKAPILYGKGLLFNDEDHPNAKAAAAILRSIHKNDCPLKLKASVEGGIVARGLADPTFLRATKVKRIALTFVPANNATLIEPVSLDKTVGNDAQDALLIKSVMHLAQEHVPSFREIQKAASGAMIATNIKKLTLAIRAIKEENLEKNIEGNIDEIRGIIKKFDSDPLDKGWKANVAAGALGIAAGTAGLSSLVQPQPGHIRSIAEPPQSPSETFSPEIKIRPSGTELNPHVAHAAEIAKTNPLLGAIAHVETRGGRNLNHVTMQHGIHKGHTAGGIWGMMPRTAVERLNADPELAKKYPDMVEDAKDIDANHAKFTDRFNSDPHAASDFAQSLYNHNRKSTGNDEMTAYSWYHGLAGAWKKKKTQGLDAISSNPYVMEVMKQYGKLNKSLDLVKMALPDKVNSLYDLKENKPGFEYTEKDAARAQYQAVREAKQLPWKPYKELINEETGKPELHVMMHRGVRDLDPNAKGKNKMKVDDTHLHMDTDSVHTLDHVTADDYSSYGKDPSKSGILSFWAPVSKIHATARQLNKDIPSVRQGQTRFEPHSVSQSHVAIKPGSYKRVTEEEMQGMHQRAPTRTITRTLRGDTKPSVFHVKGLMDPSFKHLFPPKVLNKALTAGYGGAMAPQFRTGGAVLADNGMKYITCPSCTKDQIGFKDQRRCRKCNKAFDMTTLAKLFRR